MSATAMLNESEICVLCSEPHNGFAKQYTGLGHVWGFLDTTGD